LARGAGDFRKSDFASGCRESAKHLVERHVLGRLFDFDNSRLAGIDSTAKFRLGQFHGLALPLDRQSRANAQVEHLALFFSQNQKVGGIPERPSRRLQRFSFFSLHEVLAFAPARFLGRFLDGFVVLFQPFLATGNDFKDCGSLEWPLVRL
jgi:hypothetical protein